jgi:hypothetical protein
MVTRLRALYHVPLKCRQAMEALEHAVQVTLVCVSCVCV